MISKAMFVKIPNNRFVRSVSRACRRVLASLLIILILVFWTSSKLPRIPIVNFPPHQEIAHAAVTSYTAAGTLGTNTCTAPSTGNFTNDAPPDNTNDLYLCDTDNSPNTEEDAQFSNFSFGLTAGVQILGIVVHLNDVSLTTAGTGTQDFKIRLSWDAGTTWTAAAQNDADNCTTGDIASTALDGDEYYCSNKTTTAATSDPSSGTLWGRTAWTTTELNTTNFVVHVTGDNSSNTARVNRFDIVEVKIYYTSTFTQSAYRWYVDSSNENVTDPWGGSDLAENTPIPTIPSTDGLPVTSIDMRLRVALTVGTINLPTSDVQFTLQYKTGNVDCTSGSWTAVPSFGAPGIPFTYTSSTSVTDGADLSAAKLTPTDVLQEYARSSPTQVNHNSATTTQDIEYDFHMSTSPGDITNLTQYSFRVAYIFAGNSSALGTYSVCPSVTSRPGISSLMRHGKFFESGAEKGFFWVN